MLLAHHPFALSELTRLGLPSFTDATVGDPERLKEELVQVSKRGWAAEIGELRTDCASIAAPITDNTDRTVGAIGIFGSLPAAVDGRSAVATTSSTASAMPAGRYPGNWVRSAIESIRRVEHA